MNPLLELADRVEAATGPDRDLDFRIQRAIGIGHWPDTKMWPPFSIGSKAEREIPGYTASIDAALTLGAKIRHIEWVEGGVEACCFGDKFDSAVYLAHAATPALALTAASLRAIASMGSSG